ncbi:MAG: carbohydrate-binding family 9-like protein [Verrucomicrobia bacterium]|nr:carbohydrate-binding family 9-like protein [Verrucomicrobiota bacterium]MBU1735285.1 carbohydrate-binding family 9-like protein [Verrucomicrobiota bacterium]MBU1856137.1 carbohydrate-binding family 9-like protein [Verrucomicrobiota bacterium]
MLKSMPGPFLLIACFLILVPVTQAAVHGTAFVAVGRAEKAPVIDGVLDDPCWNDCVELGNFFVLNGHGIPAKEDADTKVYVTYDSKNLYIAFKCLDRILNPVLNQLHLFKAEVGGDQGDTLNVFKDDCVEIFLSCGAEVTDSYYHLCVNSRGTVYDSIGAVNPAGWNSKAIVKGSIGDDAWRIEISIPLESLSKTEIIPGKSVWRANFCRNAKPTAETSSWCPASTRGFHCPEIFGELRFGEKVPGVKNVIFSKFGQGANRLSAQFRNSLAEDRDFSLSISALFDDSERMNFSEKVPVKAGLAASCTVEYIVDTANMCAGGVFAAPGDPTETKLVSAGFNLKAGEYHFKADIKSDYKCAADKPYNFFLVHSADKGYEAIPQAEAPLKSDGWVRVQGDILADKDRISEIWLVKWAQRQITGELLVDNIEIIDKKTGQNLLPNGDFQNGPFGWSTCTPLCKGFGNGAEKITYSYSMATGQSALYQSPLFCQSLINENPRISSQFVNFADKGAYRVDELFLSVDAPERLSLVLKSDKADGAQKVYCEIKMPDSCRICFPVEQSSAVEPGRVEEKIFSENGEVTRSYVMEFDSGALTHAKDASWKYVAIPVVFEATALEAGKESGTILYKAWIDEKEKEGDYHKLKIGILPPLAGKQPGSLPLIIWAYPSMNEFHMLSNDQQEKFISKMAHAGFNYAAIKKSAVEKFAGKGIKGFTLLPTVSIAGNFPCVKEFIKEHPEAAARYPDGKAAEAIDPAYLLEENCLFQQPMKEVFRQYVQAFPAQLNWDYEFNVTPNGKNDRTQIGFSDRNMEMFRRHANIPETEPLDAKAISSRFADKWIDFRCWQNARTAGLYRKLIKEIKPDCIFSFYSGYPPDSATHYGAKWEYLSKEVDLPMCGYGGNNKVMMNSITQSYFNAGLLIMAYADQNPLENTLVNFLAEAGSYMTYIHFVIDGRFFQAASRASAIAADFEEFFLNLKGNRRDELVCGDDAKPRQDVKVIVNGDRRLLLVFNYSAEDKLIHLRNKDVPPGFVGVDHDTKELIRGVESMELRVAPWKVKAVYLCPEKETAVSLNIAPIPEDMPNYRGRVARWRDGQSHMKKYELKYGGVPVLDESAAVTNMPGCCFQFPGEAAKFDPVYWQVRAVDLKGKNKGPWSKVSSMKLNGSTPFYRHAQTEHDPFSGFGLYWEKHSWCAGGALNILEKDYAVTHGGEYSLKCKNLFIDGCSFWRNPRTPGSATKLPKVAAGEKYVLSSWLKTEGPEVRSYVAVDILNGEAKGIKSFKSAEIAGSSDWSKVDLEIAVPKDADTFRVSFWVNGKGTGWCGDMKLAKIQ